MLCLCDQWSFCRRWFILRQVIEQSLWRMGEPTNLLIGKCSIRKIYIVSMLIIWNYVICHCSEEDEILPDNKSLHKIISNKVPKKRKHVSTCWFHSIVKLLVLAYWKLEMVSFGLFSQIQKVLSSDSILFKWGALVQYKRAYNNWLKLNRHL